MVYVNTTTGWPHHHLHGHTLHHLHCHTRHHLHETHTQLALCLGTAKGEESVHRVTLENFTQAEVAEVGEVTEVNGVTEVSSLTYWPIGGSTSRHVHIIGGLSADSVMDGVCQNRNSIVTHDLH